MRRGAACTSCAPPSTRSRSAWERCVPTIHAWTRATSARRGSRAGSRSVAAMPASSRCEAARSRTSCARAGEGVQTLLLEGGPTIAASFVAAGLVDKVMLFVAPVVAGDGPLGLTAPVELTGVRVERIGEDVVLEGYVHEP